VKRLFPIVIGLLLLALAGPAQAGPLEREHYSWTDAYSFDDCGFVIDVEVTGEGVFMLKAPRADGAPPYLFDNYDVHETLTANGRTVTIDHQGLYKDLRISHVSGTIYQFTAMEAGQPWVARDADGNVLVRDRGVIKTTFQVDTMGDTNLDNDVFLDATWSVLQVSGPHPAFGEDFDFCAHATEWFFG
jgi:hypothetical protein